MEFILKVPVLGDIYLGEQEIIVGIGEIIEIPPKTLEDLREQAWLEFISNPRKVRFKDEPEARFITTDEQRSIFNNLPAIRTGHFYVSNHKMDYFSNRFYIQLSAEYVEKRPSSIQTVSRRKNSNSNNDSDGDLFDAMFVGALLLG